MTRTASPSPVPDAVTQEQAARFGAALARLHPGAGKIGLAVSGGPDSLAMLLLAEAAMPGEIEVATVDHGLRPEAADEAAFVARVCAERAIPCTILKVAVAGPNLQAAARKARYAALLDWACERGIHAVATAHHIDDQAETLLMRLNRGSGVSGLAGVRAWQPMGHWHVKPIRPLLEFRKSELEDIVARAGLQPVRDPSNADPRFDRVRMRAGLQNADWIDPLGLARSARNLADAEEAVEWAVEAEWRERVERSPGEIRYRGTWERAAVRLVPREVALRLVQRAIAALGGDGGRGDAARLADELEAGRGGNIAGVLATVEDRDWVFRPEPARRS